MPGSTKKPVRNARVVDERPSDEEITVTIRVRRRRALPQKITRQLTYAEYAARYGASESDLDKVAAFAASVRLNVIERDAAKRKIAVRGNVTDVQAAFGTRLRTYAAQSGEYRGREGSLSVPSSLAKIVTGVFGLDNRRVAKPHFRATKLSANEIVGAGAAAAPQLVAHALGTIAFKPTELAHRYGFPSKATGKGQTIAILELGGGFRPSELKTYFKSIGVKPPVVDVATFPGSGTNKPGTDPFASNNPDIEVMLDIEIAAAIAPGARTIVYFAPNASGHSFITVLAAAIHDAHNKPSVISISWGGAENTSAPQFEHDMNDLLETAAHLGITVCVASGDNGSADFALDEWDGRAHVDFPASSPFALACGGTRIQPNATPDEIVWHPGPNDGTGGGVSSIFARPDYQKNVNVPKRKNPAGPARRGVPDVAGDAAQESGYRVLCDGQTFPDAANGVAAVGGTSAVAPLWAGLIARLNEALGKRVGFIHPMLYRLAGSPAFGDIRKGNNGDYKAAKGWDPCTGLGVPNGQALLAALLGGGQAPRLSRDRRGRLSSTQPATIARL